MTAIAMITFCVIAAFCFVVGLILGYLYGGRDSVSLKDANAMAKERDDHINLLQSRLKNQADQHASDKRIKKWQHTRLTALHREIAVWFKGEGKE